MLKLKSRDLPLIMFRREMPAFLGPDGETCYIEIDARAGGAVNPAYQAKLEQLGKLARVMQKKVVKITNEDEQVDFEFDGTIDLNLKWFGVIYDTCVIEWRSNIINDDAPIVCNRENFLALTEVRVPELAKALADFKAATEEAAKDVEKDDAATIKN